MELRAAEALPALLHGGVEPPALADGAAPHPLLLLAVALPLRRARHEHVVQRVVVSVRLAHHLETERRGRRAGEVVRSVISLSQKQQQ